MAGRTGVGGSRVLRPAELLRCRQPAAHIYLDDVCACGTGRFAAHRHDLGSGSIEGSCGAREICILCFAASHGGQWMASHHPDSNASAFSLAAPSKVAVPADGLEDPTALSLTSVSEEEKCMVSASFERWRPRSTSPKQLLVDEGASDRCLHC